MPDSVVVRRLIGFGFLSLSMDTKILSMYFALLYTYVYSISWIGIESQMVTCEVYLYE